MFEFWRQEIAIVFFYKLYHFVIYFNILVPIHTRPSTAAKYYYLKRFFHIWLLIMWKRKKNHLIKTSESWTWSFPIPFFFEMKGQNAHLKYNSIVFFPYYFAYLKESNWKLIVNFFLNIFAVTYVHQTHTYSLYKWIIIYNKENRIKKTTQINLSSIVTGAIAFSAVFLFDHTSSICVDNGDDDDDISDWFCTKV